jgi:hypothetical protein
MLEFLFDLGIQIFIYQNYVAVVKTAMGLR